MIKKIEIENIKAIKHTVINFEKNRYQFLYDNIFNEKYVNPIAVYGTNGSGKSSFIFAFALLINILWKTPDKYSMFIPNLFEKEIKNSKLKIWFNLDNNEYIYFIETNLEHGIVGEYLSMNKVEVFSKNDNFNYNYNGKLEKLKSSSYSVLRKLANDYEDIIVKNAYNFLSNITFVDASRRGFISKLLEQKSINDLMVEKSPDVKEILKTYKSFPVYDFYCKNNLDGSKDFYISMNINNKEEILPATFLSTGMRNQSVLLSIMTELPEHSVLFIDELENSLHPLTVIEFIETVKRKNIQLIFTAHNTYILQKLRPDQIIFSNWKDGFSTYKKLSDIYPNIREVNNIEKMYLSNLFDDEIKK